MPQGLPVSRLINVDVVLTPQLARFPNFNTCLLLGTSTVIDTQQRMREYTDLDGVAADFGTNVPEYAAARLWFGQSPSPDTLLIGRWANTPSNGQLIGGPLDVANRTISPWLLIDDGAFQITINGVGPTEIGNLDFSAVENMNGVASVIESGFPGGSVTCVWDAENFRFVLTSVDETGEASTLSFGSAPNAGTDISDMMVITDANGAYTADGVDAQSALETVQIFQDRFSTQWYGLVIPAATDEDHLAVAGYIEALDALHYYGVTTQDADTLVAGNEDCVAALLQALGVSQTAIQYSSSSPYAIISALARILTTNWQANSSTITLMYKNEPLVTAETLSQTEMSALQAKNCNVFVEYNNQTAIFENGVACSGQFIDTVIGVDWLSSSIQTTVYNLLYGSTTKIPQTDSGMNQIVAQIDAVLAQAVANGLLAPGVWNAGGFGQLKQGDYLSKGYYIYAPPVGSQSQSDRAARMSVPFQIAAKLAGAVHTVDVTVTVES